MRFASITEVAKLPRLAPLSLASIRRGTRIRSAPAAAQTRPINSALEDKPRKPFTFTTAVVLAGSSVEYLTDDEWKGLSRSGFRAAAAAALQWQAGMEPSFLPSFSPLCSHTLGCRHRCCDSDRFAWKKPFRLLGGGEGGGERAAGMRRGSAQKPQPQQQQRRVSRISSAIPAGQGTAAEGAHPGGAGAPAPTVCGGMDAAANNVGSL